MTGSMSRRLAVLIDAENISPCIAAKLMAEISRCGRPTVRRAYGDWTKSNLAGWTKHIHRLAIVPIQQFRLTVGKSVTDAALIVDAMDLLHSGCVDGFCLVSSDSDFTPLALRIRQAGFPVYGFGAKITPQPFVEACDRFVYVESLQPAPATTSRAPAAQAPLGASQNGGNSLNTPSQQTISSPPLQTPLEPLLTAAVTSAAGDDGWAEVGRVALWLRKADPTFNPRNYGRAKLGGLVKIQPFLEVRVQGTHLYVRLKKRGQHNGAGASTNGLNNSVGRVPDHTQSDASRT
jgi:hypothetical protein